MMCIYIYNYNIIIIIIMTLLTGECISPGHLGLHGSATVAYSLAQVHAAKSAIGCPHMTVADLGFCEGGFI